MVFGMLTMPRLLLYSYAPTVDQPVGTGFSYTSSDKYVHTMEEVTFHQRTYSLFVYLFRWQAQAQIIQFFRNFYEVFPEYRIVDVRTARLFLNHRLTPRGRPISREKALLVNGYHITVGHFTAEICVQV